ncbi:MAG: hypothetical protein JWN93_2344 [Hyphomicrobiales bacterium]|nr:hypothetical protein [Hyphomicrobiales bacterium]
MNANGFVRAGLTALALAAACAPAGADTLQIGYSVRLIGLSLGTAGLSATVDRANYKVDVSAQLSGLAAAVSRSEGAASAYGNISNGRILAETYATTTSNSKETRTVRMAMNAGSVRAVEIAPPFEEPPGRVPVTEAHKRGVVDPLSALVMPATAEGPLVGPNACNRSIPVFDGYTRFDVALRFVGVRDVQARGYSGPVAICSARYRPISGHRPDRPSTKFMIDNRDMEVWLMPLEGARALAPFRISVKTMIGSVVIEATNVAVAESGSTSRASR